MSVPKAKLFSFKFKRNKYGDCGFNQVMARDLKEVKDVNAYYDSFPLMD